MFKIFNNKLLNGQSRTITSAAFILAATSLASRFLGLWRDRLLAGNFGAGDTLDIYYAAFRLPDLIYNLLITGVLSAGFIPIFVSLWRDRERNQEAWNFTNSLLNILLISLIIIGGLFFIGAPYLMKLITPGFSSDKMTLTVSVTRLMFLSPLLLGISSVWAGVLQSLKRFFVFSLAPVFYNLGIIVGILFLAPRWGIFGLAGGVIIGAASHMLIQLPAVRSAGFRYRPIFGWADKGVRRLARLMIPRTLTLGISQLNFLAITALGSGLAVGSLAIFNLTYNIWTFPLGILGASLAIAAFPSLSQAAAQKNKSEFVKIFVGTTRQMLFWIVPASVLLIVLRAQLVRVILGAGKFDWQATILTINALQYLTLGLGAEALSLLLVRGFFAWEDTKTPFWLAIISSVVRIGGAWWLSRDLGVAGLALGYALGGVVNTLLLWIFLERKIKNLGTGAVIKYGLKVILASMAGGTAAFLILRLMAGWVGTSTLIGVFNQGLMAGLTGLVVYFFFGWLFRLSEIAIFWQVIKNRLPFKSVAPDEELIG